MFNKISPLQITNKAIEILRKHNEPSYKKSTSLGFRENRNRLCLHKQSDCSLCLRLEYNRGLVLDSQPIFKYYNGWNIVDNQEEIINIWLDVIKKM